MRDLCFITTKTTELHLVQRVTGDAQWGAKTASYNVELWAGRLYVCASFHRERVQRRARKAGFAACLLVSWCLPSPLLDVTQAGAERPCAELAVNREFAPHK